MNILVTGGAGFIGSHVVDLLVGQGHRVTVVDNLSTGRRENVHPKAKLVKADITDGKRVHPIFKRVKPEAVLHLAAQMNVRISVERPVFDAEANIIGSLHCLEASVAVGAKKFVFASSGGAVYGVQNVYPADEAHPTKPIAPYGIAKLSVEHYLRFFEDTHGLETVALRLANVYGPRQNPLGEAGVIAIFYHKMLRGERPTIYGTGEQTRDFVYVSDVARAFVRALSLRGVFNVGTGVETSVNQLYDMISRSIGFREPAVYGPAKSGELLRNCISSEHLRPWRPEVTLEDGLALTADWFRNSK